MDEIFRTPSVSAEVKVFLLFLAHYEMDAKGVISVPRDVLAERTRCHPSKVTEKLKSAIDAGLLKLVVRGQKYRTSVYSAVVPDSPQVTGNRSPETPAQGTGSRSPEAAPQVTKKRSPESRDRPAQGTGSRSPEKGFPYKDRARTRPPALLTADGSDTPASAAGEASLFVVPEKSLTKDSVASRRETHAKSRRRPETTIPDIFRVTGEMRDWAKKHARNITVDLDDQTERFANHAKQNDRRCRDWAAAWRNWILKAQDFADRDRKQAAGAVVENTGSWDV
jgi:hypothetical protein